jgi:hypothetical protein
MTGGRHLSYRNARISQHSAASAGVTSRAAIGDELVVAAVTGAKPQEAVVIRRPRRRTRATTRASTSTTPRTRRPSSPATSTTSRRPSRTAAPLRRRVERQLGYKQAKYVRAIELVGGKGGYWEDEGYEWYGGI